MSYKFVELCAFIILASSTLVAAPRARAEPSFDLDLPAQPLADALRAVGKRTDTNILIDRRLVGDRQAPALKARMTVSEAIEQLIAGTGLAVRRIDERTLTLVSPVSLVSPPVATFGESSRINLAQVEVKPSTDEQAEVPAVAPGALEEIVVTGSHIRGIHNETVPIRVLDRAYIESTGISTTVGLLESIPQNFALASQGALFIPNMTVDGAQGASINLRGVGEGTTLTLLNGRRLAPGFAGAAVDISGLPLSAIERVEILTDGASAIYGSDAVGGVVNFILRKDFEGAETKLRAGTARGGVNEYRASQALGHAWGSGNALASFDYYRRDLLEAKNRDFVPDASFIGSLLPKDENYSLMASADQEIRANLRVFAYALYTRRDSFNAGGQTLFHINFDNENPQLSADLGFELKVSPTWQIELSGSQSRNELRTAHHNDQGSSSNSNSRFTITGAQMKADGELFNIPGGASRAALGVDWRTERMHWREVDVASGLQNFLLEKRQTVRSAFAEVHVPVVGKPNERSGLRRLEVSLAGRYDDYSSFGSSLDPQAGIMWEPIGGLRFRASYGTSYKAPNVPDYNVGFNFAAAFFNPDPSSVPGGISHLMEIDGTDPDSFKAQRSKSTSLGIEFSPAAIKGLQLALNYYTIDFSDRIAVPTFDSILVLSHPETFGDLIVYDPSLEQVEQAIAAGELGFGLIAFDENFDPDLNFDPASVEAIVDLRRRNLSQVDTSGFDISVQYGVVTAWGDLHLSLDATHILDRRDRITPTSASIDRVDTIYNPPDWRVRSSLGWQRHRWGASLFANYTDSYSDNRFTVPTSVSSLVTFDTHVAYELARATVSLNVQNLFDRDPPRIASSPLFPGFDIGYDPTNANPLGRLVSLELIKKW